MKKISHIFALLALLTLVSCASYHSNDLTALDPQYVNEYEGLEGIKIGCKAFSQTDCETYLDRDVLVKGYQPIQITFMNHSDKSYVFTTENLNVPCVSPEVVAKNVHTSTTGRVVGYTAGALIVFPLLIPAIVDGIKSYNANNTLDLDYQIKSQATFIISPNVFIKNLIFVPKQFSPTALEITLIEKVSQEPKTINIPVH